MKNKIIFVVLFYFLIPFAFAQNTFPAEPATASVKATPKRGTLYRIRHQGNTTYLFGTIHVGKPAFFPLEPEVTQALHQATTLVVELDVRNNEPFMHAIRKHGFYSGDDTIDKHLSPQSLTQLRQSLQAFDVPFDQIVRMKPWVVMNMLISLELEHHGYQRTNGIELFLLSIAGAEAKKVQELESAEYQLSLYDSMTPAEQERYLVENLEELADGSALKKAQELLDAWETANGTAMENILREARAEKSITSDFMQRVLLDKRNPEMATQIEALLKNGESSFVGVGMLHLVGATGVPALLRQRGYHVEKLY